MGFTLNKQAKLVKDLTYRGRRQIQIIECKYSTDGNIQSIIEHIYEIYESLRQVLQAYSTLKADVKTIPIVISRAGTFHVKTLAKISQLVSFTEEPRDGLPFKQLPPRPKKSQWHSTYMHKNGYPTYPKSQEKSSPQILKRSQLPDLSTENFCPKTSLTLAAGAEEEDEQQADMAYMAGSFSLP